MKFEDIKDDIGIEHNVEYRLFKKPHWENLYVVWNNKHRHYFYVKYDPEKDILYYSRSHGDNKSYSLVSMKVVSDADLYYAATAISNSIHWKGKNGEYYSSMEDADKNLRIYRLINPIRARFKLNKTKPEKSNEEKNEMANVNFIGGEYYVANIQYLDGMGISYSFKVDIGTELKENDKVVVHSTNGYGIGTVTKIFSKETSEKEVMAAYEKAKAWVVCKIDDELHQARIDATERKKYIMKRLAEKKDQAEELLIYKTLAESDSEVADLLSELNGLGKSTKVLENKS